MSSTTGRPIAPRARRSLRFVAKDLVYGLCWIGARPGVEGIRVSLLYHSVGGDDPASVSTADFSRQMDYLRRHFRTVRLRDFRATIEASEPLGAIACVTFDDGLLDNFECALPILEERGIPASFFVPTGIIGQAHRTWNGLERCMDAGQLRELARRGHEIGSHTVTHPDLTRVNAAELDHEIRDSKKALEDLLSEPVTSFAYPKGRWNGAVRDAVERAGFASAVTVREGLVADRGVDWLTVPRVWINPTMGTLQYRAKLSNAVTTYERIRGRYA